ncbi:Nif3-like dinuclear metal center hexameric protein [Candidatus Cardinium sp. TP]|uniref:Nif3-like dinuclear metal center hexameric protein n=1 Tax=Candidatus Cardinium sp. TP TaxID=2961955 RepID=UPI0021AEF3DC|nr:Nif3-like dinuclear metal center hexameric protein [Candidatus Cardinium sp. TP]MCT4697183.1 Nif3-like dinuclear metal center hexameric protein [Candidatus Cardinium sp. TP]MDN5247097.1 Nif3-like dinuclear metal center hexameric protein [Candidatus Cardinium sp.]
MTIKAPRYSDTVVTIADIINCLEQKVQLSQHSIATSGVVVGDIGNVVTGILIALDITEALLEEAVEKGCNFIIVHQPIFVEPLAQIIPESYAGRCVIKAIQHALTIYVFSSNLDHLGRGTSHRMANLIELQQTRPIMPHKVMLYRLTTFVPPHATKPLMQALCQVGALLATQNLTGVAACAADARLEFAQESQLAFIVPMPCKEQIIQTLLHVHPYEKVTYHLEQVEVIVNSTGSGLLGTLPIELPAKYFLKYIKTKLTLAHLQHTNHFDRPIKNVAVYAGSGGWLLKEVLHKKIDAFITTGLQYEQFLEANGKTLLIDIGYHATRLGLKRLILALLSKEFNNIVILRCKTITNPVHHIND